MNKIKILCLILAVILVLPVMASCTGNKVTSTVTLKFQVPTEEVDEDGNVKYEVKFTDKITVEGTTNNKPTVLQAVQLAFAEYEIDYELSKDSRQSVTEIYEGDEIVFTWTSDFKNRQDTAAVQTTDPNADTTGIVHSDDTTVPVDSAEEVA